MAEYQRMQYLPFGQSEAGPDPCPPASGTPMPCQTNHGKAAPSSWMSPVNSKYPSWKIKNIFQRGGSSSRANETEASDHQTRVWVERNVTYVRHRGQKMASLLLTPAAADKIMQINIFTYTKTSSTRTIQAGYNLYTIHVIF